MGRKTRKKQKTRAQRSVESSPGWESATDRDIPSGGEGSNSNRASRSSSPATLDRTQDQAIASKISFLYHTRNYRHVDID